MVLRDGIERGVSPDVVAAHVISPSAARTTKLEKELLRPSVSGAQIKRYQNWLSDQLIVYTTRDTELTKYPNVEKHLRAFKHLNTCKEVIQNNHPWSSLHRPRDPKIFLSPKLIGLTTTKTIELIYDETSSVYVTDAMYVFALKPDQDPWAVMAILQSKLFLFLYRVGNQGESRVIPQVKASKLQNLPFPAGQASKETVRQLNRASRNMLLLSKELFAAKNPNDKIRFEREIEATDSQIDRLVYGVTEEEIKIVEETLADSQ